MTFQGWVLHALWIGTATGQELLRRLLHAKVDFNPASLTKTLQRLEEYGWIEHAVEFGYGLTPIGREIADREAITLRRLHGQES